MQLATNYELRGGQAASRHKLQVLLPQKVVELLLLLLLLHTCGKWQRVLGERGRDEVHGGGGDAAQICILSEFSGIAVGLHAALGTRGN